MSNATNMTEKVKNLEALLRNANDLINKNIYSKQSPSHEKHSANPNKGFNTDTEKRR